MTTLFNKMTIAFIPLARPTFDVPLAEEVTAQARAQLRAAGYALVGPDAPVSDLETARAVAASLVEAPVDLLLVFQATFADSTLAVALARELAAPLLLWAIPEARTGGRLRLNSFCGINLAAHALKREGMLYDYLYALPDADAALEKVRALALAGRAQRLLSQARVGRVGEHPAGFDSCKVDKVALKIALGVEVAQLSLEEVFARVKATPEAEIDAALAELGETLPNLAELEQGALRRSLASYLSLRRFAEERALDGLAVRCWPEFFTELGCAACGAMSMLSNEQTPCSCEADVNGVITQLMLQWMSEQPAFGTDMVAFEVEEDVAVLWHCGLAPLSMADPAATPRATIHSNRKLPLLMEFPLKPGRVTVARFSEAQGTGRYRLVIGGGEMLRAPMSFSGTSGVIRFDRGTAAVLDTLLREGLEHHISLTYGDHLPALRALAQILALPVLEL